MGAVAGGVTGGLLARRNPVAGAVIGAVAGGIIGGAIIGGAIASSPPPYGGPVYVEEAPPPCRWVRERFWDGYQWRFRRIEVCN